MPARLLRRNLTAALTRNGDNICKISLRCFHRHPSSMEPMSLCIVRPAVHHCQHMPSISARVHLPLYLPTVLMSCQAFDGQIRRLYGIKMLSAQARGIYGIIPSEGMLGLSGYNRNSLTILYDLNIISRLITFTRETSGPDQFNVLWHKVCHPSSWCRIPSASFYFHH